MGGRAHDLTVRVQQLEAELPGVEKALLSEPNQLRFAYTNGTSSQEIFSLSHYNHLLILKIIIVANIYDITSEKQLN